MPGFVGAIDQGTTSTRFAVVDRRGRIVALAQQEHRQIYPRPGWVEHDAAEIRDRTFAVIGEALAAAGLAPADLAAVGVSNQRETTVVWDAATGEPLAPAIVWQDTRTADRAPPWPATPGPTVSGPPPACPWPPTSPGPNWPGSWTRCPACGPGPRRGRPCSAPSTPGWSGTSPAGTSPM